MAIPIKKLLNGFTLPVLSMGTWMIGGGATRDPECNEDLAVESIRFGLNAGITCIDTAEMYAAGFTEQLVGRAIKNYTRKELQLISKVSPRNLRYSDVLRSLDLSLERLRTDYLDVYLIHKPNPNIPLKETIRAMKTLREQGLVREIGVSNFGIATLHQAQEHLGFPIVLDQVHYNLMFREPEISGLLDYCQENDIFVMAWRPLEKGVLAADRPDIIKKFSDKYDRTPAQIIINWLISQDNVVTLSTMRSKKNLKENLGAVGWSLEAEDVEKLRAAFPNQKSVSNREPLL